MKLRARAAAAAVAAAAAWLPCVSARAESLQCSGGTVGEGDSRISVAYKCGNPVLQDSHCRPVVLLVPAHPHHPGLVTPQPPVCEQIDEWLYDRGPGNLMAKVRFRSAKVESIEYGRFPR